MPGEKRCHYRVAVLMEVLAQRPEMRGDPGESMDQDNRLAVCASQMEGGAQRVEQIRSAGAGQPAITARIPTSTRGTSTRAWRSMRN